MAASLLCVASSRLICPVALALLEGVALPLGVIRFAIAKLNQLAPTRNSEEWLLPQKRSRLLSRLTQEQIDTIVRVSNILGEEE